MFCTVNSELITTPNLYPQYFNSCASHLRAECGLNYLPNEKDADNEEEI